MSDTRQVRVRPLDLRGPAEGYTFPCSVANCRGKKEGEPLPQNCRLPDYAHSVSGLDTNVILVRLISAGCTKQTD